jgi:NAD(P)-dependent dehydrogenase (short-subunit alcohol dehydrogenase family)
VLLSGKKIVVTGGAGVLGQAVGEVAKAGGAEVVLLDVVPDFKSDIGDTHTLDLTDAQAVADCFASIGQFNALANIAGGFDMGPTVYETEDALWDAMFNINVSTLRTVVRVAVPILIGQGGGSIVNVGALGALRGGGNMGAYAAAKSTVMRLTEALSDEVKLQGINVNAVLPSLIDTPRNRADMPDADFSTWVDPRHLASVICFLASDAARAVHGALVPVSGLL